MVTSAMTGSCNLGRWERLLSESDDAAVWRATDWKGDFHIDRTGDNLCHSDDFKCHFESVLNREDVHNNNADDVTTPPTINVTIPITKQFCI